MRVSLFQMTSGISAASNADALAAAIADAAAAGATMLFTPEMSGLIDRNRTRAAESIVDEEHDMVLAAVMRAAFDHSIWVALGSLACKQDRQGGKNANRSFLIDDQGTIRTRYDKVHLFDVDLPSGESWRESNAYAPGDQLAVTACPVGQLGLSICYDVRFPGLYQALSQAGATVLAVPSAFTVPTGMAHWHILLRTRAIENACWVIAAAQTGTHEDGRATYGHSLVIDPWGEIVLDMGQETGLGYADIDLGKVQTARNRIPVIAHRRSFDGLDVMK